MCCGRKKPRLVGGRSKLIKKRHQEKTLPDAVPEVPIEPRPEQDSNKIEEQKQENNSK